MYRKCGAVTGSPLQMVLGGSLSDPMAKADIYRSPFDLCALHAKSACSKLKFATGLMILKFATGLMYCSFKICTPNQFAECTEIPQLVDDPRQFDVFAHVDESGFLHFMDHGGENGLFGCKDPEVRFSVLPTSCACKM